MKGTDRLFGRPWAEILYRDLADAYESTVEGDPALENGEAVIIEEWTVSDNAKLMPSADRVIEEICEIAAMGEISEGWYEAAENGADDEVKALIQQAIDLWASKITFWMADKKVYTHFIRLEDDVVLVDGAPLYRKRDDDTSA